MSQRVFNVSTTSSHTCSKSLCKAFELVMLKQISKAATNAKNVKRIEDRIGVDVELFIQGTYQQSHQSVTKRLKTCVTTGGGHIEHML